MRPQDKQTVSTVLHLILGVNSTVPCTVINLCDTVLEKMKVETNGDGNSFGFEASHDLVNVFLDVRGRCAVKKQE